MKKSFYDWCIENNHQDLLNRWDYELNTNAPEKISWATNVKCYFKCDKHNEHKSVYVRIASLTSASQNILCPECCSLAQWIIDKYGVKYLNQVWNTELNDKSPWDISAKASYTIFLNCDKIEYHKGYKTTPARYTGGQKVCGFCHMMQIHPNDSFAMFNIKRLGNDFLLKYWDYDKNKVNPFCISPYTRQKVWIKCQEKSYHGSYDVSAQDFSYGKSNCPYCRSLRVHLNDSVAYNYPEVISLWSDKNKMSPNSYSLHSNKDVWLKCSCGKHKDFRKHMRDAILNSFRCPECTRERSESYLQEKVKTYIISNYKLDIKHEYSCTIVARNSKTGHCMPYDNDVRLQNNQHLIIEVHGEQHYKLTPFATMQAKQRGITPEQALADQQYRDLIKKDYAISQGYFYLAIPYWTERDESYKTLIDNKIHEILTLITQQNN